jgi:hypothetical protein
MCVDSRNPVRLRQLTLKHSATDRSKLQDKAKAEVGVQVVQRWVLAALRKRRFFALAELNEAILELVDKLNARPFRKLAGSRAEHYRLLDRPALQPLPRQPFVYAEWNKARVNLDYHIERKSTKRRFQKATGSHSDPRWCGWNNNGSKEIKQELDAQTSGAAPAAPHHQGNGPHERMLAHIQRNPQSCHLTKQETIMMLTVIHLPFS